MAFTDGYGFTVDALNRAAFSNGVNVAEGNGRFTEAERRSSFRIARGSA